MVLPRPRTMRASISVVGAAARRPVQRFQQRAYASMTEEAKKKSNLPWLVALVAFGGPAIYYLAQSGPKKELHPDHHTKHRAVELLEKDAKAGISREKASAGEKPSDYDPPASRKEPGGPGTMSGKQEGLDNADTANPHVTDPGKSVKGEDETDSVKLKGSISPERPQV